MPVYLPEAYLWPCESSTMDQFYETTELHFKSTIKTLEQNVKAICVVLVCLLLTLKIFHTLF